MIYCTPKELAYRTGWNEMSFQKWLMNSPYWGLPSPVQLAEMAWNAGQASKQAEIDRLMLEFCPDEMTQMQKEEWAKAQRAAPSQEPHNDHNDQTRSQLVDPVVWINPVGLAIESNDTFIVRRNKDGKATTPLYATPPDAAAQIAELEKRLWESSNLHCELAEIKGELQEQIAKLGRKNVEYAQYITVLEAQRGDSDVEIKMIDVLNDQNQRLQDQIAELNDEVMRLEYEKENLREQIANLEAERDARIEELEATIRRIKEEGSKCKQPAK